MCAQCSSLSATTHSMEYHQRFFTHLELKLLIFLILRNHLGDLVKEHHILASFETQCDSQYSKRANQHLYI